VRDKKFCFGCRVTDYGNDDFEIVPSGDRRRHMKKMWTKCESNLQINQISSTTALGLQAILKRDQYNNLSKTLVSFLNINVDFLQVFHIKLTETISTETREMMLASSRSN